MPRDSLLLVDLSYQIFRATCAHPLLSSNGVFTGGLYGFFMFLGKAVRETRATRIAFCQDSKPYRRSLVYPEYKLLRKAAMDPEVKERYEVSKGLVFGTLLDVGAPIYGVEGFEADDLIGALALRNRHRMARIYAGANDSDLFQLLWMDNFAIFKTDMANVITQDVLWRTHGVTPDQYMLATALSGTHNDVAGIAGVGEKTAVKAVKDPALMRTYRAKHADIIDRNLSLIKLPHADLPGSCGLLDPPAWSFNPRDLYRALGRYDIDVTDAMVKAFEQTGV